MAKTGADYQREGRLRRQKLTPPKHDASSYSNWVCRCETCKASWRVLMVANRKARIKVGPPYHGHPRGNQDYGCNCGPCLSIRRELRKQAK